MVNQTLLIANQILLINLEKEMAIHSSTLEWKIPWTEVPGSPWGHKESDMTERFHFSFLINHTRMC